MLREMSIRHFAIIDHVRLTFDNGFHVLTGETGAGKSILIDAIGLLVGGRGSADFVRHGKGKAEIEGLFEVPAEHPVRDVLSELGIEPEEDVLIIRREIAASGKSTCRINGRMVTLAMLKQVGERLLDIHGQHEHQSLLKPEEHVEWLDAFGGETVLAKRREYEVVYRKYRDLEREWQRLTVDEKEMAQRIDLLRFQQEEIAAAKLTEGEEEELELERKRLAHAEKIVQNASEAYEALYGERRGLEHLHDALQALEEIAQVDESIRSVWEMVQSAYYQLEEAARELGTYRDQLEFDPDRLVEVEDRLHLIHQLKRKYGDSIRDILSFGERVQEELERLLNRDENKEALEAEMRKLRAELDQKADELTALRKQAARRLEERVEKELADLNMGATTFHVAFYSSETPNGLTPTGKDRIEFQIAPNPGEPLRPLAKIASGGELSRIMLALKTLFADVDHIPTLIFDEIDTGVSGRAAQAIAEKMVALGRKSQVLCITHLPQVACMADTHFYIYKEAESGHTQTHVEKLDRQGRTLELARMLGGVEVTDTTREHAQEMLQMAEQMKKAI
ncbi:DNA repair protein RecN [Polycladomyces abyssicola]|uniref:DNA repair protein RecN n=1 Tax=Polycladomyces abyssicola TaxID=1125966 RepID=A0A8D5UEC2_9BACL|nr:DNA repair protein RecN [Polycladomyces abyssicola]BCU81605.1 DNA repair protein RecN [Polycladomyces abyssicola]